MESALADVLIGRMLDRRYLVRSRIAHGGMATVYLATDTRLDRQVALKVMHADLARDADFVDRFIGEAKSVARLSHPNIVAVFDQGSDGQYLYLAMEYVPGRTLRSLLRERHRFPYAEALDIMDPILSGLAAAHRAGVVHRDVKPENVLLTADGRVKVVDFGLARTQAAAGHTRTGLIIGTVAYIAPEQVTGVTDPRTDVYAAGVMLWEMLTGSQPHTGESPLAVAYRHVNSDVPAVGDYVAGVPPAVDHLVRSATSRDPRLRPADAGAFLRAVRSLRGIAGQGDAVTGAWRAERDAGYGAAAGYGEGAGSHTMIVAGHSGYPTDSGAPARGYDGYDGDGEYETREPFLQRWLFSRRLAFLAVAVAVLIAIGFGGWWLTSGRYAPLPAVDGMSEAAAAQALRAAGFAVQQGTEVIDNNVPKGDVISTSPSGRAVHGATVILTVSAGPRMIQIPSVTGLSVAGAMARLRQAGLTVSNTTTPVGVNGAARGSVAGTTPPAGTSWPANRAVSVDVVAGIPLPDLVGQNIGDVQAWAASNNIQLNQVSVHSDQPQGVIVRQSPAQGAPVGPGVTVTVYVSIGPPEVTIPNVRGESFQQAQQQLEQLGFQVQGQQFGFGQTVFGTNPSGQAQAGSTIVVYYGGL
ncbi:Stk1 family PASTA domain-containing Ser/Thr kinase [Trebonia sp.]|uniref:Stk1 family PASTA domain-containing Ser/Thr kinase n=1 Tax=Trebonia sp. TaxID=2767075 RepID=UPI00260E3733|nr:Stk1 family PASTA domain-containing Ser/Thr kinase [Trebonia sp.]